MPHTHPATTPLRAWAVLAGTALVVLVAKAYVMLPLLVRGIVGQGLYRRLNTVQFPETAVFTLLAVWWVAARFLRWPHARALGAGVAAALMNFGLMVLDARWATYNEAIEAMIEQRWGGRGALLAMGAACAAAGALGLALLCRKGAAA